MRYHLFATRRATSLQRPCKRGALNHSQNSESSRSETDFHPLTGLDIPISVGAVPSAASARLFRPGCSPIFISLLYVVFYLRCGAAPAECGCPPFAGSGERPGAGGADPHPRWGRDGGSAHWHASRGALPAAPYRHRGRRPYPPLRETVAGYVRRD